MLLLADGFVREFAVLYHRDVRGWDAATEAWLLSNPWPGNVRELRETLRIAVLRAACSRIQRADLKVWAAGEEDGPEDLQADTVMRRHLRRVLEVTRGNLTRAGRLLGWERNKVRREARRLGVPLRHTDADGERDEEAEAAGTDSEGDGNDADECAGGGQPGADTRSARPGGDTEVTAEASVSSPAALEEPSRPRAAIAAGVV